MCCLDFAYQKYQLNLYYQTLDEVSDGEDDGAHQIKPVDIGHLITMLSNAKRVLC